MNAERLRQRFARLATDVVVRHPRLWALFRAPLRRSFDAVAHRWDQIRTANPEHLAALERALEAVGAPTRVLDVGTGTGAAAFTIARRFPGATVVGVDLSPGMIEQATRNLPPELAPRVSFAVGDASALPFEDGAFDLVVLANMIPFADELARLVAPGGTLVVSYSRGPATPIYVASERLERDLGARGLGTFERVTAGAGTALVARAPLAR